VLSNGSGVSTLAAKAEWVRGKRHITGQLWTGHGTFADCLVVWARNTTSDQVNAFIVKTGTVGMSTVKIEKKPLLQCIQCRWLT
jgi:acyl-CoA oxidase